MEYYRDLRQYIDALEASGKLVRLKREINKDTELHPLVRWQFRGLPEDERKAFLFENVTDVKGRKYNSPVLVASHAASRDVYALAMMCKPEEIMKKWEEAELHPIEPKIVESGPVQEEIHMGSSLLEHGGLEEFPIPISTPGFDNAPYITAGNWVTKDPDTGIRNVGNYRGMVKSRTKLGCQSHLPKHLRIHREKCKKKGIPVMPAAVVVGASPNIGLTAVTRIPYGVDEYAIAGGIAGRPVELVKCKTVDIEVPATAEIVIEGEIPTDYLEREGPFGEFTGYMAVGIAGVFLDVTCITHRRKPIWNAFISQFPPSESSTIREPGLAATYYKLLKHDLGLYNLIDVASHRESGSAMFIAISLEAPSHGDVWKALNGAAALEPRSGKLIVVVDSDIDVRDIDSVIWAMCFRMQPIRDIRVTPGKIPDLDPSTNPPEARKELGQHYGSVILIDATRKWDYPPTALPGREFMEQARKIWEEEGLPQLRPKVPWFGYSLGYWTEEFKEEAELALKGEHYQTGEKLARNKIKG